MCALFLLEFFLCYDPAVPEGSEFFHLVSCRSVARVSALGARYFGFYYGLQPCELARDRCATTNKGLMAKLAVWMPSRKGV